MGFFKKQIGIFIVFTIVPIILFIGAYLHNPFSVVLLLFFAFFVMIYGVFLFKKKR